MQEDFWEGNHQRTFFDVRVFNPMASSYRATAVSSLYRRFERAKQRMYEQRVMEVEMSSFTPLVFFTFGGMGRAVTVAFRRLASLFAAHHHQPFITAMAWFRCSNRLLRSAVTCLRGAKSHRGSPVTVGALDLVVSEGQVLPSH